MYAKLYKPLTEFDCSKIAVRHNLGKSHTQRALGMLSEREIRQQLHGRNESHHFITARLSIGG